MPSSFAKFNPLNDFRWNYRIVLIASSADDEEKFVSILRRDKAAVDERDILWFVLSDESVSTNYAKSLPSGIQSALNKRYFESSGDGTRVLLIGKDGGVKSRENTLDLAGIYSRIDSMPIRRQEMKGQRSGDI